MAEMRAGVPAVVPHEAAKRVIAKAGLDSTACTRPAMAWHLAFRPHGARARTCSAAAAISCRPAWWFRSSRTVFLPHEGLGARLIDNVDHHRDGCELLSVTPRELAVID